MMVKSSQRAGRKELTKHLLSDENERVRVVASRGVFDGTIFGALEEFEAIARGSNCQKYMFHVSASPAPGETMTGKHWEILWRNHEQINGLEDASFIQIEHDKKNRIHQHRVYLRVNSETGKAVNLAWTRLKNERLARMCEAHFGHKIIQGKFNKSVIRHLKKDGYKKIVMKLEASGIADRAPRVTQITHSENQQIRNGFDLKVARATVADCWAMSDSPEAFNVALNEAGFVLAEGDKMGVPVVVDADGRVIPLQRSISAHRKAGGLSSIKKKEFMKMIPGQLPDLDAVREELADQENLNISKSQQAEITEEIIIMNNTPKQHGKISNSKETERTKKTDKQKLLEEYYGQEIKNLELSRYWRVDRLGDGSLQLKNKAGSVIDKGDSIDVDTTGKQLPTAAAALQLASLKGWDELNISGSDEFKRAVYKLAIESGTKIQITNNHDRALFEQVYKVAEQRKMQEGNSISPANETTDTILQKNQKIDVNEFFDNDESEHDHERDHDRGHNHRPK